MKSISEEEWQQLKAQFTWEEEKTIEDVSLPPNTGPILCRILRSNSLYVKETIRKDGTTMRELGVPGDFPELTSEA